jgi:hypothetical protein
MNRTRISFLFFIIVAVAASTWYMAWSDRPGKVFDDNDPDRSPTGARMPMEEYLLQRNENLDLLRGYDTAKQQSRTDSIRQMEQSERHLREQNRLNDVPDGTSWVPLGPAPIPISGSTAYSGRV